MKGLELSQRFFFEVGLPNIQKELPGVVPYLAAGLSTGSQCHGNDDEISRDHGWGPGFSVWLNKAIMQQYGKKLQEILDSLPDEYLGPSLIQPGKSPSDLIRLGNIRLMSGKSGFLRILRLCGMVPNQ